MFQFKIVRFLGLSIVVIIFLTIIVLDLFGVMKIMESIANLIFIGIGALLVIAFELIVFPERFVKKRERIEKVETRAIKPIDQPYAHLTILFPQRNDTPERPTRPYYIANSKTKQAFWVPNNLLELAKQGIIEWLTYDGEKALRKYLKDEEYRPLKRFPEADELSISLPIFIGLRRELPSLKTFLTKAKSEIVLLGFSMETISRQNSDVIKSSIKQGIHVTFLILNPNSNLLNRIEQDVGTKNLAQAISASLGNLCQIREELPQNERNRLEIRTYDLLPMHNIIAIDPKSTNGEMQVEHYHYKSDPSLRTNFFVSKKDGKKHFEKYWNSYLYVFDKSEVYSCQ